MYIHTHINMQYFFLQLTSLCVTASRFIYLTGTDSNSFFFMAEKYSIVYMYHIFLTDSSVYGYLSCLHILATVNSVAVNIGVHVSF